MKLWDAAWMESMDNEGVQIDLYVRYVDDSRNMLRPLAPGWRWNDGFDYKQEWAEEDKANGMNPQVRTTTELTKAMNGLVWFLRLTGEDHTMFEDGKLPTLDTSIWVNAKQEVKYEFYEKPTVPNRVLQRDTALSDTTITSSLTQEVVRRMLNCSLDTSKEVLCDILSKFAQKMLNSGHSQWATKVVLVHGVTKYNYMVEASQLSKRNKRYKPLHLPKAYRESDRQVNKYLAKMTWHRGKDKSLGSGSQSWRSKLVGAWRGNQPAQRPVRGMRYSTVLQVPSTGGSRLLREIAKVKPKLAKASGFSVKLVERSGVQLARLFDRKMERPTCGRSNCAPCTQANGKSRCKKCNVVYRATCQECKAMGSNCVGTYVGETSRTLAERSSEHTTLLNNFDPKSFMVKHWAQSHGELNEAPLFKFEVVKQHKDSLSRMLHEALLIEKEANLNSKSEFRSNRLTRLVIEVAPWEEKKVACAKAQEEKAELCRILQLKNRVKEVRTTRNKDDHPCEGPDEQCVDKQKLSNNGHTKLDRVKVDKVSLKIVSCRKRKSNSTGMEMKRPKTADDHLSLIHI